MSKPGPGLDADYAIDFVPLALRAIESAVLNRFRYMNIGHARYARKIRNRARDFEYAMIPARR